MWVKSKYQICLPLIISFFLFNCVKKPAPPELGPSTSFTIYDSCWNVVCNSSPTVTASMGNSSITIVYGNLLSSGSHALTMGIPAPGQAVIILNNPSRQPVGTSWFSKSGVITNIQTTSGIQIVFNNVPCVQTFSSNTIVSASGTINCY